MACARLQRGSTNGLFHILDRNSVHSRLIERNGATESNFVARPELQLKRDVL